MDLIEKYIGESESLTESTLNKIKGADIKKLSKLLNNKNIPFDIVKGKIVVDDGDLNKVEDLMISKLKIF